MLVADAVPLIPEYVMSKSGQKLHLTMGLLLLLASVPLLIWQAVPHNQQLIPHVSFLAMHSLMEVFAIIVAALVFLTGYGTQESVRSIRLSALGCAFLAVAWFDTLHFLSYAGMPDVVSSNTPHKAIVFWLLARYAAGLGLLAYVLLPDTPLNRSAARSYAWLGWLALLAAGSYALLLDPHIVPTMYVEGVGLSPLKIWLEWGCSRYTF